MSPQYTPTTINRYINSMCKHSIGETIKLKL